VGPEHFETPYASISLRTIGASAGVGVIAVLGEHSCGVAETAHIARYLAGQSSGQCGPCVFGLPAIADDLALLARGQGDSGLMTRLQRRLGEVNGRGACRHPDGAVSLVRSALAVFGRDVSAHDKGEPCAHWRKPSSFPFPRPVAQ
jgi:NADH:ubiquinone oxidoreductase subunit F (NADH-binding)